MIFFPLSITLPENLSKIKWLEGKEKNKANNQDDHFLKELECFK